MPILRLLGALALAIAPPLCTAATHDPWKHVRESFRRAYAHVETGSQALQRPDSEDLRSYPLYPYLQAARIRRTLADAGPDLSPVDERAQTFVTLYEFEPAGRELRRTWLASLAQRGQWALFLEQFRPQLADDMLRCHEFSARIAADMTQTLAADIARQWLTPQSLPACEQAFDWLRARNALSDELIEQRARLALAAGNADFARQLVAMLPATRAAPLLQWAALLDYPQHGIDALIAAPDKPVEPAALLAGWTKFARVNRDAALLRFDTLVRNRGLNEQAASPYALALALPLSWDRRAETLAYFERVAAADFDDNAREWQVRAALWAGDWTLVARAIDSMPESQRAAARWRYWAARAAGQMHDLPRARQLYESTLSDDNFYSAMSAARLDRPVAPHPQKLPREEQRLQAIAQMPAMVRAHELLLCDMYPQALAEWQQGYSRLSAAGQPQTIHLAAKWGWYEQAIATATQLRIFNDYELLYPRPYDQQVRAARRLTDLDDELIYAVLRQESLYRADAVSTAGAMGLLQLMPDTARRTARTWRRPRPSPTDLLDPAINIPLGAAQLRSLIDRFNGQRPVALAGYNAGPGAAARWLPADPIDADVWIENIPYNETRAYVQRILWHSVVFAWLRSGEPQRTDSWIVRVAPPGEQAVLGGR